MKIYVAGKWTEPEKVNYIQQKCIELGHKITHDWTKFEPIKRLCDLTEEEEKKYDINCAILDIEAVQECDFVIAIMDDHEYAYRGTFTEIGCALGLNKKIIIMCPQDTNEKKFYCRTNCFFHHPIIWNVHNIDDIFNLLD
jgi:nucleoside 2-deoxyribosyltransferase